MGRKQRFTISTDERIYGPIEIIQSVQYSTRGYVSFRGKIFFLSLFLFLILDLLSFSLSLLVFGFLHASPLAFCLTELPISAKLHAGRI